MRIDKFRNETKGIAIPFGDDVLNLQYRPNAYTPQTELEMDNIKTGVYAGEQTASMLCLMVDSWDMEDEFRAVDLAENYVPSGEPDAVVFSARAGKLVEVRLADEGDGFSFVHGSAQQLVPLTTLGLRHVPFKAQEKIIAAITEDSSPEKKSSGSLGSFS